MNPILLDTCAALWIVDGDKSSSARATIAEANRLGVPIYVSPITAWEIGLSARKGRFKSPYSPRDWFVHLTSMPGTYIAELTATILLDSSFMPGLDETDPADRIIAATAREYGFTLMTRDRGLLDYGREGYLSVLEC
jgi:PIN domain nuclease of toxin-antitoxin system